MKHMHLRCAASTLLYLLVPLDCAAQLEVSENGRYLVEQDGKPFFWLGDPGWAFFQKPTREEVILYQDTRAK